MMLQCSKREQDNNTIGLERTGNRFVVLHGTQAGILRETPRHGSPIMIC